MFIFFNQILKYNTYVKLLDNSAEFVYKIKIKILHTIIPTSNTFNHYIIHFGLDIK